MRCAGFTLLEVLVSLFFLSIILLSFESMQIVSRRQSETNYFFQTAVTAIDEIYDRLALLKNKNNLVSQIQAWQDHLKRELPNGRGNVIGTYPHYEVLLQWGKNKNCEKTQIGLSGCVREKFHLAA